MGSRVTIKTLRDAITQEPPTIVSRSPVTQEMRSKSSQKHLKLRCLRQVPSRGRAGRPLVGDDSCSGKVTKARAKEKAMAMIKVPPVLYDQLLWHKKSPQPTLH